MIKTIMLGSSILMALGIMAGCAGSNELVKAMSSSTTQSAQEFEENMPTAQVYADMRIYSSLKTHGTRYHSIKDNHGTPDYKMLLTIDGQTILLRGSMQIEDSEPRGLADPEAGYGIRYRFSKSLRLKAGTHRVVVTIPDDGIVVESEITVVEGNVNNLVLEPIYKTTPAMRRPGVGSTTSFKEGISSVRLALNGRGI
jgi:hypothetical protein